jgi:hypothetical protein
MNIERGDWLQRELCKMAGYEEQHLTVQDYDDRIFVTVNPPSRDRKVFSTPHNIDASVVEKEMWLHRFNNQIRRHFK